MDVETGAVAVERYHVAADVGRALNPLIVEGQLVGGVVQGLGGTLMRTKLSYDTTSPAANRSSFAALCAALGEDGHDPRYANLA